MVQYMLGYPLLEDLRGHGMRDGLIVVFFASRTIKIPLLPIMIDYFGWVFTLVLTLTYWLVPLFRDCCWNYLIPDVTRILNTKRKWAEEKKKFERGKL
jgi:hypothetical protein